MLILNEKINYDPFKDMHKSSNGRYTDGLGNSFDKPSKSKSDVIKYKGLDFYYDYKKSLLIVEEKGEEVGAIGLQLGNWLDNPSYWIEKAYQDGV